MSIAASVGLTALSVNATLPTNYEHFTAGGIHSGLSADKPKFTLNNKELFIYSGALHYFRVPRPYWRDRLRKMRACGMNTVETYVPWNLHEPKSGHFDFGNGGSDMADFLHLQEFLKIAKEEDLFAIVRPGPFICAEFEFGGLPSWLLREDKINVRSSDSIFMKYVTRYFNALLPILALLQFTKGGPIIAFQVENEYSISRKRDYEYLKLLRQMMLNHGIKELMVTADNPPRGTGGTIRNLFFMTGTILHNPKEQLDMLKSLQPNRPVMAMEYYPGWFDFWGNAHSQKSVDVFRSEYEEFLKYPASINLYMFQGGTSFGFMNGAQNLKLDDENTDYRSITNSYDYLALLDEAGNYTEKYHVTKHLIAKYNPVKTRLPAEPSVAQREAYNSIKMEQQLSFPDILNSLPSVHSKNVIPMEKLDINDHNGQSYGYVVYRKTNVHIPANGTLMIEGRVCDTIMVLVNGVLVSPWLQKSRDMYRFGTSKIKDSTLVLSEKDLHGATIDLVVENWGRINVAVYKAFKGLWQGGVKLNNQYLYDWTIYPLEFKQAWTKSLSKWHNINKNTVGPSLYRGRLHINGSPRDTFVHMEKWSKGIIIVNGFVLGRYARMGPIQTSYLPANLLKAGDNLIYIFEHFKPPTDFAVDFSKDNIYKSY